MKRRSFSIKGLAKRKSKSESDAVCGADSTAAAVPKTQGKEKGPSDTKKKRHSSKHSKTPEESPESKDVPKISNNVDDAPPPYTEFDGAGVDDSAGREVLISWDEAVRRCIPFNDLEGLPHARADSGSTLEDDLIYGTNEILNQYESLVLDCEDEEEEDDLNGSASLPARYLSSISGRKAFTKVNSVQDLRLGSKMYGTSHTVPQFYDLHGRGIPPPSRTLVGEGLPQGTMRRSLPTSYSSRPAENVLLDMDGPGSRVRSHPHTQPAPNRYLSRGFHGNSSGGRRSPPPREERIANGLKRSTGCVSARPGRSRYTPAIAVRRDPVPSPKATGGQPVDAGHVLSAISPSASRHSDISQSAPVGILKRDAPDSNDGESPVANGAEEHCQEARVTAAESARKEKAVVFGAYQPKKPDVTSTSRREAKKAALKNMNISRAMEAAAVGNVVALQHLLQMKVPGIEFNALSRDEDQRATVIHRSAEAGRLECLKFLMGSLLSHSATPQDATTLVDIADRTPAMLALQHGHLHCLKYLLECGNGDVEIDDHGHTLLHHAAYHGQTECLQYLLDLARKNGKDLSDCSDDVDVTPAHVAAQQGHINCLRLLVEYELDICQADVDGLTPLDWATKANEPLCQHYLTMVEKCWDLTDQLEQAQEKLDRAVREVAPLREQLDEASSKKSNLQKTLEVTKAQCEKKIEQNERDCARALSSFLHMLAPDQQKVLCQQLPTSLLSALSMSQKKLTSDPLPDKARSLPRQLDIDPSSPTASEGDSSDDRSTSSQHSIGADSGCGLDASCSSNVSNESKDTTAV